MFVNENPGMSVANHAGVDALHNGTDMSIKDEPNQEQDENGENYLSGEEQVPTLEGDVDDNELSTHHSITSTTIKHIITNINTSLQNMTLAVTLGMMEQFLP